MPLVFTGEKCAPVYHDVMTREVCGEGLGDMTSN